MKYKEKGNQELTWMCNAEYKEAKDAEGQ